MARLTHLGADGKADMVDVGTKAETERTAIAEGSVTMQPETLRIILDGNAKKGDVLGAARIAGIMAAKKTHELIPLCHPLLLTKVAVDIEPDKNTCCGCVAPWNEHPLCKQKGKTVWERMVMPRSWVETFEKYGFYWLGHDTLEDTMHFEFLGDPDKITD